MKKIALLLCLIGLMANAQVTNYNVGDVVDDFTLTDTEGNIHNLYDITSEGKYVFLDFFFVDCVPCQTWQPTFSELHDKYGCNEGEVYCLSVNAGIDDDAAVIAYENTYGGPFNHAPAVSMEGGSGAVDANFGISAYPTFCLINPDNEILVLDIWPLTGVETFEATFPTGFDPQPMTCTILGVSDASNLDFVIYPTISDGRAINIHLNEQLDTNINVYDVLGKQVYFNSFTQKDIQLSLNIATGTYFINISSETGTVTKAIIIK